MKIQGYIKKEFCILDLKALTREDAVRDIVSALPTSKVNDKEKFISEILARETLGSTAIGYGVAIPHARTDVVNEFVIGFGRSKAGIDFKSNNGDKVHLLFVMGAHPRDLNLYLVLLAELAKCLMDKSFREALLSTANPDGVVDLFQKFSAR